jgi:mannose-6-phosphate isomerase-like protein (cupin superfamily)
MQRTGISYRGRIRDGRVVLNDPVSLADGTKVEIEVIKPYELIDFASLPGTPCPCGTARRAFTETEDFPGTIHVTEIELDNTLHYHKKLTETYYFLKCEPDAKMQLNDDIIDVHPGSCIMIRPGTRHRAIGRMKVLIVVYPKFDPADEWFD